MGSNPTLSAIQILRVSMDIVSLVYNRENDVKNLLDSIQIQSEMPKNVWLIDNGSNRPLTIDSSKYSFPVHVVRIENNIGIAGYNLGFKKSQAKYVMAVDSDVTLDRNAIKVFKKAIQDYPDLVVGGARILDATTQTTMFDNPIHAEPELPGGGQQMVQFNGCCFLVLREAFLGLGGFDQRLFIYVNEWDFTLRVFNRFRMDQIRYYSEAVAYHKTAPSSDRAKLYDALIRRNEFWVRWKYYPLGSALNYSARFYVGSIKRMILGGPKDFKLFGGYLLSGTQGLTWALRERQELPSAVFEQLMKMRDTCEQPENLVRNI
ncbi:MAG TPA: glycosyltransferase [Oligoflexia bacterium]|nr:glycosyltransferase [Oligoflexia bacterium]